MKTQSTGDEVLEWNGRSLQGKSYEEVYDILAETRHESQVELIVSRQLADVGRHPIRRNTYGPTRGKITPILFYSHYFLVRINLNVFFLCIILQN